MKIENLLNVTNRDELRAWFTNNASAEKFCWIVITTKPENGVVQYLDAVEEALCFGWIDGTKKKISETQLAQRFSPRTKNSNWTELNKARARRLEELGLMTDAGRKVLPDISKEAFVIDQDIIDKLKEDEQTYQNFLAFPELYKIIRIDNIQTNKSIPELFNKRLEKFIENTKNNKMYGQWNDGGRLS